MYLPLILVNFIIRIWEINYGIVLLLIGTIVTPVASMQASGSKTLFPNPKKIEAPTKSEEIELGTPTTPIDI